MRAFPATNLNVRGFVKRIAGDGDDVEELRVLNKPVTFYEATIGNDGDGFNPQVLFAVSGIDFC